jgi:hypothetical protein
MEKGAEVAALRDGRRRRVQLLVHLRQRLGERVMPALARLGRVAERGERLADPLLDDGRVQDARFDRRQAGLVGRQHRHLKPVLAHAAPALVVIDAGYRRTSANCRSLGS